MTSTGTAPPLADRIRLLASGAGPEAEDTMVGELVVVAAYCTLVESRPIPSYFGMFDDEGNSAVEERFRSLVAEVEPLLDGMTPDERIDRIWGDSWGVDVFVSPEDCDQPNE